MTEMTINNPDPLLQDINDVTPLRKIADALQRMSLSVDTKELLIDLVAVTVKVAELVVNKGCKPGRRCLASISDAHTAAACSGLKSRRTSALYQDSVHRGLHVGKQVSLAMSSPAIPTSASAAFDHAQADRT